MAISIEELRINDIVLSTKNDTVRRCIVRAIHNDSVSVEILNMQTGKMECEELDCGELEPVLLMESTLYTFGFRKTENIYYGSPTNISYILKREGINDIIAIKTSQWHLLVHSNNGLFLDKHELYLHTLQNFLSHNEEIADEVNYNKFVELTNPYCVLPFEPKEE